MSRSRTLNIIAIVGCILLALPAWGSLGLVVKPLVGKECTMVLSSIVKIVYQDDSMYVYDATQTIIYKQSLSDVQHIRFTNTTHGSSTDVEDTTEDGEVKVIVYPNPTPHLLYVKNVQQKDLRIYSANGHLIQTYTGVENMEIDMSGYPTGVYILNCENKNFQIIKQ